MRSSLIYCLVIVLMVPSAHGEPLFSEHRLNAFVSDLVDADNLRHSLLTARQSAIHRWLIHDCMQQRTFKADSTVSSASWNDALYRNYAYCQDHYIEGVDPPCPSGEVFEASLNDSCWTRAHDQIDWSGDIMHVLMEVQAGGGFMSCFWHDDSTDQSLAQLRQPRPSAQRYATRPDLQLNRDSHNCSESPGSLSRCAVEVLHWISSTLSGNSHHSISPMCTFAPISRESGTSAAG